ncbi:MAG TPA: alpha/beta hydrolase [Solirubrobacteraceae bacterium]|nr:alpha/beta hydrolase [Solirubrobacteraceae bacterium]
MRELGTHRGGEGEPLVLIHGFSGSPLVWEPVVEELQRSFDVMTVALTGHVGGPTLGDGERVSVAALVDQVEREMDDARFETAHIAGNSLGGWIALELANRGRARSVVALAPAGGWERGTRAERRLKALFTRSHAMSTRMLPYMPKLLSRPRLRRLLLGQAVARGDLLDPGSALALVRSAVECPIYFDLMDAILGDGPPEGFPEIACPVLIAWGTRDRIIPARTYSARMREMVPAAEWLELRGLGHMPMGDDRELIARTIAEFATAAQSSAVAQPAG